MRCCYYSTIRLIADGREKPENVVKTRDEFHISEEGVTKVKKKERRNCAVTPARRTFSRLPGSKPSRRD